MELRCFFVSEMKSKEQYERFMEYLLLHSEYFSVIYFRYTENERMKKRTREIHDRLTSYKVKSKFTHEWPGTVSLDENHFYKFALYQSKIEVKDILCKVDRLFDWDYPIAPMDISFYKDGYCWFSVTAHERDASLYTDDEAMIRDLEKMEIELEYLYDTDDIFYLRNWL